MSNSALVVVGALPADYRGPVYYRLAQFEHVNPSYPISGGGARENKLWDRDNVPALIFKSGIITDSEGRLLPEWQTPLKMRRKPSPVRPAEFIPSSPCTLVSARVHAAIEALEPGKHIFVPIDAVRADGTVERYYYLYAPRAVVHNPLHISANRLTAAPEGGPGVYRENPWNVMVDDRIWYLDAKKIGTQHLIENSSFIFSAELAESIGNVYPRGYSLVPMGVV